MNNPANSFSCYIVSLKYAPGLWKEFTLLGNKLSSVGYHVCYLLSKKYAWMGNMENVIYITTSENTTQVIKDSFLLFYSLRSTVSDLFQHHSPAFLLLYNTHPLNLLLQQEAVRFYPRGIRAVYLHEPAKSEKGQYGLYGAALFSVIERLQSRVIACSTDVLLPSPYAQTLFLNHYHKYGGRTHYTPLLIRDTVGLGDEPRRYFTMLGRFNFSKRLDLFIQIINLAAEQNSGFSFQIVTTSQIQNSLNHLTPSGKAITNIVNPDHLSDEQINQSVRSSIAVLCLHSGVTQSGVLPVCFKYSTPVIALNTPGFSQHIQNGENGQLVPTNSTPAQILKTMKHVHNNWALLSRNARRTYEAIFSDANWTTFYNPILNILKSIQHT